MQQKKTISEIVLNKDEALAKFLIKKIREKEGGDTVGIENEPNKKFWLKNDYIRKLLLEVDLKAVNLTPYDTSLLDDINKGHWDIYRYIEPKESSISFMLEKPLNAKSPVLDVKSGTVGIDFGTKSTVAGFIDENSYKRLLRIGTGERKTNIAKNDYENPTVIEFIDINSFMEAYHSTKSRPLTLWNDICISHTAANNLLEANNDDFYRFFTSLKQWAADNNNKIRIKDEHEVYNLKDFLDCGEKDINPIELYAYYIGRYINNMREGIYLDYLLSYPVKYDKKVREKIRESFERGLRKAIPYAVLCHTDYAKKFKVQMIASEPAAYAISALKEYGFAKEELGDEKIHYGIFDFGGGTTDFDFGIWSLSKKNNKDFDIKHFGAGGKAFLGGENLLTLLAYEVFKQNKEVMSQNDCSFTKPIINTGGFGGDEELISDSQEARKNTIKLIDELRVFWENLDLFIKDDEAKETQKELDSDDLKIINNILEGNLKIQLTDNKTNTISVDLQINIQPLIDILKKEIKEGVESFYHSLKSVGDKFQGLETFHIFLAGNASRSPLVKEAFNETITKIKEDYNNTQGNYGGMFEIKLYPPLGTPEADVFKKEHGLKLDENNDLSTKITCKTGVVFGLLDSRKASEINVISEVASDDEAKFNFYLGRKKFGKFCIVIDKELDPSSGDWHEFTEFDEDDDVDHFELYYTTDARANSNKLKIEEVKRLTCPLDKKYEQAIKIKIKVLGANTIKYGVFALDDDSKALWESAELELKN